VSPDIWKTMLRDSTLYGDEKRRIIIGDPIRCGSQEHHEAVLGGTAARILRLKSGVRTPRATVAAM
jgi:hypothetical protein